MVTSKSVITAAGVLALAIPLSHAQPVSAPQITWSECDANLTTALECGTLPVPLDYADPDGTKLNLSMVRMKHTKEPFLGSIFFNPGGPGYGARNQLAGWGVAFLNMTGGQFDLIGHDPRGTGDTIPFSCFETTLERTYVSDTYQASSSTSDTAPGFAWAGAELIGNVCAITQNETGTLIGSAYTARDIMAMVDALGEDGMLRFWGFSYGSALGSILAKMFPDRVDRIIIDGVLNMHQYYAAEDYGQISAMDDAFSSFIAGCADAGPDRCVLARADKTAADLEGEFYALLEELTYQPILLGELDWISEIRLKSLVSNGLRTPVFLWPLLAGAIDAINTRNATAWQLYAYPVLGAVDSAGSPFPELGLESTLGIRGGDTNPAIRTDDLSSLDGLRDIFYNTSVLAGDTFFDQQAMKFRRWKMSAKEIIPFEGDMNIQTKHPLLLIGNPLDHLTPLSNAFNTSANFEGSVVLQHNGAGHCSLGQPSMCTARYAAAYFVNGTLPEPGTQCDPDLIPFSDEASTLRKRDAISDEDWDLLQAMSKVRLI